MNQAPQMPASVLVELLDMLDGAAIQFWLDGGWGVDALLEEQSRLHKDVDLILRTSDVSRLIQLFAPRGFRIKEGRPPDSFVLANGLGLEIDVHAVAFDGAGNGVYRMQNGLDWIYPEQGFQGRGTIEGRPVPCLSASTQVLCHAHGYQPSEKDFQDMHLLERRFGLQLPLKLKPAPPPPDRRSENETA